MDNEKMLPQLSGIILEEQTELTLAEVCRACTVNVGCIVELVEKASSHPSGASRIAGASVEFTCVAPRSPCGCNVIWASISPVRRWHYSCWTKLKICGHG